MAHASAISIDAPSHAKPRKVIVPVTGWNFIKVRELWQYRELLFFFTLRDIQIRYKQTLFGAAWAVIQPTMMMVVFTLVLGRMAKVDSGGLPYPVFVYAGLLPWTFFAGAISNAGNSIVGSQHIITKIYFPRLVIPFASIGAAVVDFAVAFLVLIVLMFVYHVPLGWQILLIPVPLLLITLAAMGVGCLLSALNVAFRDFKYTIPFLVQMWLFATPTVYMTMGETPRAETSQASATVADANAVSARAVADGSREGVHDDAARNIFPTEGFHAATLLRLNPMTDVIEFFRAAVLGGPIHWGRLLPSAVMTLGLLFFGLLYFRRVESRLADII